MVHDVLLNALAELHNVLDGRCLTGAVEGIQQARNRDRGDDSNDRNDDQKLDKGETFFISHFNKPPGSYIFNFHPD
jgi:hypothetical protein